ncbi:MAG TPA: MlaD family protein [Gemmatimonadales bacterium]|nr:MlaD family protein [Gemmatimonadales bacterium]
MDTTRQDFIVGLLIVTAIAVVVGALLATSGWGERRYDLYLRAANAEGLTIDSRVLLQGLEVGRVVNVSPRVDSMTRHVSFIARLKVIERFSGGANLRLPVGTSAQLEQANQLSPNVLVRLVLPDTVRRGAGNAMLVAGDTIDSERKAPVLNEVADVATRLSTEVTDVLHAAHQTLLAVQSTLRQANTTIADLRPDVRRTLANVASTMDRINTLVARVDPGLADTVSRAVVLSTRTLARLDSLIANANAMTVENRQDIRGTMQNIDHLTLQLNHLAEEMSRRPYRFLTGVKPLSFDTNPPPGASTVHADSVRASAVAKDSTHP